MYRVNREEDFKVNDNKIAVLKRFPFTFTMTKIIYKFI